MSIVCQEYNLESLVEIVSGRKQQTLSDPCVISGQGLFTGCNVSISIKPAPVNTGIVFKRVDLAGEALVPAQLPYVQDSLLCTMLGIERIKVQTIEHLLAALKGLEIDNAIIEINAPEVPILDGSAKDFVSLLTRTGIEKQKLSSRTLRVKQPIYISSGDATIVALPSEDYRISYTLNYPKSSLLRAQFYSAAITKETFEKEIAECRTFAFYEEIFPLIEKGYIKGGGLESAVIIKEEMILNPEGVRFPEEMARHKVLDIVGDLSLINMNLQAHIIAIRSGHALNVQLARKLVNSIKMES